MNALNVYDILLRREEHEDNLFSQRLSVCSMVNSILLVAFFMAVPTNLFVNVRLVLPIIGIAFSVGFIVVLCVGAKAMVGCYNALSKLEKKPDFLSMKKDESRLFTDIAGLKPESKHIWKIGAYMAPAFPLCFIIIWIFCFF